MSGDSMACAFLLEAVTQRLQAEASSGSLRCGCDSCLALDRNGELLPLLQLLHEFGRDLDASDSSSLGDELPERLLAGMILEDYRLLHEIGRGGMGIVYEAEEIPLQRRVAVKVLSLAGTASSKWRRRFENEALAAASLDHPHIVPVYATGRVEDIHFYTMPRIDGQSLATILAGMRSAAGRAGGSARRVCRNGAGEFLHVAGKSPAGAVTMPGDRRERWQSYFRGVAGLGIQAAGALHYAHQCGINHRDVKPSNLLIDAGGHLWITDFGLAQLAADAGLTGSGEVVGTLRYAAPEQFQPDLGPADCRVDIYGLGLTLYELLTLEPAFPAEDRRELLEQVLGVEPVTPRKINQAIPRDLEAIVRKAIAREPRQRYATAGELAADLQRYLHHEPIRARPHCWWDRALKFVRRHAALLTMTLAAACTLIVLLTTGMLMIRKERDKASAERGAAVAAYTAAETHFVRARHAVDRMMATADELVDIPRTDAARHSLLEEALEFYQAFLTQRQTDPSLQYDTAMAYLQVGLIHERLGNVPHFEEAARETVQLLEPLVRRQPGRLDYQLGLVDGLRAWAASLVLTPTRWEEAERLIHRRVAVLTRMVHDFPNTWEGHRRLAMAYTDDGELLWRMNRDEDAERHFRSALAEWERAADSPEATAERAATWHGLGTFLLQTSQVTESRSCSSKRGDCCKGCLTGGPRRAPGGTIWQASIAT